MKKIITGLSISMLSIFSFALVTPVHAATDWDVTGAYVADFVLGGIFPHDMFLTQDSLGNVTGNGGYPVGGPYAYSWHITSGTVTDDAINLTIVYDTGSVGTTMHMSGTIAPNGSMSGDWDDNYGGERHGTWSTTAGHANGDSDEDGVPSDSDLCPGTNEDVGTWSEGLGTNRWELHANNQWYQNKPAKQGGLKSGVYDISDTYGCSGQQILEMLNETYGSVMNGHLKYGLSSGVLKEFILDLSDGVMDGKYYLETVAVPANATAPVSSVATLLSGHNYAFKASGTANAGDGIQFDADYSYRTLSSVTWTDSVSTYEAYGPTLLDLEVNGGFVDWDDDAVYNVDHTYWYETAGTNAPATFQVYDVYYPNNTGVLTVDIYAVI